MSTPEASEASGRTPARTAEAAGSTAAKVDVGANTKPTGIPGLIAWVGRVIAWVQTLKPVRVFTNYGTNGGPLLASGMSYQAVFAVFAALWAGFSIFGLALASNPVLLQSLLDQINTSVPGLIGPGGAIDPDTLLSTPALGWTGAIALVGLILTAVGFLGATRSAIRLIFGLPGPTTNPVLLKLKDFALAIAFAVVLIVSAAISIASSSALDWVFDLFGWDTASALGEGSARVIGLIVVYVFDTVVLVGTYRLLSGVPIPLKFLLPGSALGAAVMGVLKVLGSTLLGGATSNPLLASFAVIIGILIWFNFICQIVLIFASWIAVSMADAHFDPRNLTPEQAKAVAQQAELSAHRAVLTAVREETRLELADARGLRRRRLRRQLTRLDAELAPPSPPPPTSPN
ncbi:hypothetical protein BH09ACT6_BH09ACT6_25540 [soil metagenome]